MTVEAINAYFTPLDYFFYLLTLLVGMTVYYQWRWAKTCKHNVLVLIQKADGHGDFLLAPQAGGSVSLKDEKSNTTRLWPINELATIDVPYPGVDFVPAFLQKSIRMVIVSESDWEPLTNRSPHQEKIASPDIVAFLKGLKEEVKSKKTAGEIDGIVSIISSGSTREMIASPAVLGNLLHEKITEAVITVNKEMLDSISGAVKRLGKMVNPTVFYIGIGLILIVALYSVYLIVPLATDIALIKQSLGVATAPVTPAP